MGHNTLSVIMVNYNHGKFIGEALDAILSQSYRPMEIIVIDDASTDNSLEIIQQFVRRDLIIRLIRREKNMGV
jgi:glycosyltransferase involved in cell wall biosynthesis